MLGAQAFISINLGEWAGWMTLLSVAVALSTALHILLRKRDALTAAFWLVIVVFVPLLGSLFYLLFGINFIQRHGRRLRPTAGPPGR